MVVNFDSVGLYMMWAGRHALPGCVKVISSVWKPLRSTLGHNSAWWKRDTNLTFITAGAFWGSLGTRVDGFVTCSFAIVCILDCHGLWNSGWARSSRWWFSGRGRHTSDKKKYLAIRLITYVYRLFNLNQPASKHTLFWFLSHNVTVLYTCLLQVLLYREV